MNVKESTAIHFESPSHYITAVTLIGYEWGYGETPAYQIETSFGLVCELFLPSPLLMIRSTCCKGRLIARTKTMDGKTVVVGTACVACTAPTPFAVQPTSYRFSRQGFSPLTAAVEVLLGPLSGVLVMASMADALEEICNLPVPRSARQDSKVGLVQRQRIRWRLRKYQGLKL